MTYVAILLTYKVLFLSRNSLEDVMDYKETLNLPQTEFPMRGNLPQREPEIIEQWRQLGLNDKLEAAGLV